jgi:hypothetical protein
VAVTLRRSDHFSPIATELRVLSSMYFQKLLPLPELDRLSIGRFSNLPPASPSDGGKIYPSGPASVLSRFPHRLWRPPRWKPREIFRVDHSKRMESPACTALIPISILLAGKSHAQSPNALRLRVQPACIKQDSGFRDVANFGLVFSRGTNVLSIRHRRCSATNENWGGERIWPP